MTIIDDRNGLMNHKFDQTKYVTMQNKPILVNADRYNQLLEAEQIVKLFKSGEGLKIEIPNQNADIVKPITISHEESDQSDAFETHQIKIQGVTHTIQLMKPDATSQNPLQMFQLQIERLEMLNSLMLEALEGVVRVADRATQEFDAARAAIQYAKGETK